MEHGWHTTGPAPTVLNGALSRPVVVYVQVVNESFEILFS